jgi:hypothetical protein
MDREPRGNQLRLSGRQCERRVEAGAQIKACRTRGGIGWQREFLADARIEDAHLELTIANDLRRGLCDSGVHADTLARRGFARSA